MIKIEMRGRKKEINTENESMVAAELRMIRRATSHTRQPGTQTNTHTHKHTNTHSNVHRRQEKKERTGGSQLTSKRAVRKSQREHKDRKKPKNDTHTHTHTKAGHVEEGRLVEVATPCTD